MRMKSSTVVFLVVLAIVLLVALSLHFMGADASSWMSGMRKLHGG